MKVKEIMSSVAIKHCGPETTLSNVAKTMKESNLGALPVVDKDKKVIGIVTDRDVCLSYSSANGKNASELTVKDILPKTGVRTVKADDDITEVLREMRKNKVGRIPVTDNEGKLEGIISVNHLLSRAVNKKEALGHLSSKDENLAKTIKALFDRNNSALPQKKRDQLEMEASDE